MASVTMLRSALPSRPPCSGPSHRLPDAPIRRVLNPRRAVRAGAANTGDAVTEEDQRYILQALELAKRAQGQTHPNPAVGCVIVRDGRVVGEGYHPKAGMPHAEVYALRAAGQEARGACAYVTLEPCNHYGRTPPCSRALVEAGVARVVVGVGDPNPLVASAGVATLRDAGITVALMDGPESQACHDVNAEFMARMRQEALQQAAAVAAGEAGAADGAGSSAAGAGAAAGAAAPQHQQQQAGG